MIELPSLLIHHYRIYRAYRLTAATFRALGIVGNNLRVVVPGLRIRTPATAQGTALEEDSGPDTRTIMNAKSLNIENQTQPGRSLAVILR